MTKYFKFNNIFFAVMVYIAWIIVFSFYNYQTSKVGLLTELDKRLELSARNYVNIIPEGLHNKNMSKDDLTKKENYQLLMISNEYAKINGMEYLYSIIKKNNKVYFTMGNASEEDMVEEGINEVKGGGYYFVPYEAEPHFYKSFDVKEPIFNNTSDKWGNFRTVLIQHESKDGTKFVIGADIKTSYIDDLLWEEFIQTFIVSLLFLLFALPILAAFTSQIRQWAKNLELQTKKAEAANEAKSRFLAKMSHELRTPLHGILAFAELGVEKSDTGKIHDYFTKIKKSGGRLKSLLDDLLDMNKFEADQMEMNFKTHNISDVLDDCIVEQQGFIDQHHLNVSVVEDNGSHYAECDITRISQVILNLLNNAIKFSPDSTTIKIAISNIKETDDDINEALQVSFSDEGRGVPKNIRDDIFNNFYQVLNANDQIKGTGLGLAISSEIILAHNGSIWCQESESKGAQFVFRIPYHQSSKNQKLLKAKP